MPDNSFPRLQGNNIDIKRYETLPDMPADDPMQVVSEISCSLLSGAINWRCPDVFYNLGSPVNAAAAAMYAIASDANVFLINDGLAGNAVVAEQAVRCILGRLAGIDPTGCGGLFTFGGTGTNLYAMKLGLLKAFPMSRRRGIDPGCVSIIVTEDAHFSHAASANWLGVGTDGLITLKAGADRRSLLCNAQDQMERALSSGQRIATIILNGGTTYDHTVDDIGSFVKLRNELCKQYQLAYSPHIHVDSVAGWIWLYFRDYDFVENRLEIETEVLSALAEQGRRIADLRMADSWGVDFHKGPGGCPISCSVVMFNKCEEIALLSRRGSSGEALHQLARTYSTVSPVDYTLETSRPGAAPLAALVALHTLGKEGYRMAIANLIRTTLRLRRLFEKYNDFEILNKYSLGFNTMLRLYPPELQSDTRRGKELLGSGPGMAKFIVEVNDYMNMFFRWEAEDRLSRGIRGSLWSFSSQYIKGPSGAGVSAVKIYPTLALIEQDNLDKCSSLLVEQKRRFDNAVWTSRSETHTRVLSNQ